MMFLTIGLVDCHAPWVREKIWLLLFMPEALPASLVSSRVEYLSMEV